MFSSSVDPNQPRTTRNTIETHFCVFWDTLSYDWLAGNQGKKCKKLFKNNHPTLMVLFEMQLLGPILTNHSISMNKSENSIRKNKLFIHSKNPMYILVYPVGSYNGLDADLKFKSNTDIFLTTLLPPVMNNASPLFLEKFLKFFLKI